MLSICFSVLACVVSDAQPLPAPLQSAPPAPRAAAANAEEHGKLPWFKGTFEEFLAEGARTNKVMFMDFWTSWCGWCKRLDKEAFSDATVVTEMSDVLCFSVDAESAAGRPLAKRFLAKNFPTLVFLNPDGSQRDRIGGYVPVPTFLKEVQRIKRGEGTTHGLRQKLAEGPPDAAGRLDLALKLRSMGDEAAAHKEHETARALIAKGEGFDAQSVEARWTIAKKLEALGDKDGAQAQLAAIRTLDPEQKSQPMRREALDAELQAIMQRHQTDQVLDLTRLKAFLADERFPEVSFAGWSKVLDLEVYLAEEARKREQTDEQKSHRAAAREAGRKAWSHCPTASVGDWGRYLAYLYYEDDGWTTPEEKAFAVEVARAAARTAPKSVDHLEMLACTLYAAGQRDDALNELRKALEIAPNKESLLQRRAEFEAGK